MNWYRSKLILETEDSANFRPIFDRWEEIAECRSLLKVFIPFHGSSFMEINNVWGTYGHEHPIYKQGFFKSQKVEKPPLKKTRLEATFKQPGCAPYVGYRRLSYLLPGVTIHLYDPDMNKDYWYMRFVNGNSFAKIVDHTLATPSIFFCKPGEKPLGGAPWIPYSEEDAQVDIFGRKYYWDLEKSQFQFIEVETEDEIAAQQPMANIPA